MTERSFQRYCPGDRLQYRHPSTFSVILEHNRWQRRIKDDFSKEDLQTLISNCPARPRKSIIPSSGFVFAKLYFSSWRDSLEAEGYFWRRKLEFAHELNVRVESNSTPDACNRREEAEVIKDLIMKYALGLLSSECVKHYDEKIEEVIGKMREISLAKKGRVRLDVFEERQAIRRSLEDERNRLREKQAEFQAGILSILKLIGVEGEEIFEGEGGEEVEIFWHSGKLDWNQVWCLLLRECRRLEEGLPVYASRTKILNAIYSNQVL